MATLKSLVDETTNIKNDLTNCYNRLKAILVDKDFDIPPGEKLEVLIEKVEPLKRIFPNLYLYKAGDTCDSVSGGYSKTSAGGSLEFNTANMQLYASSSSITTTASCIVFSKNKINLKNYSKISFTVYAYGQYGQMRSNTRAYLSVCQEKSTAPSASSTKIFNFIDLSAISL